MGRMRGGRTVTFGLLCSEATAAYFCFPLLAAESLFLWNYGMEKNGKELAHLHGERRHEGCGVVGSLARLASGHTEAICVTVIVAVMPAFPLLCLSTGIIVGPQLISLFPAAR